jgi:N-glycosylase/DNA lyase
MSTITKNSKIELPEYDLIKVEDVLSYFSNPKTDRDIFYNLCFVLMVAGTKFSTTRSVVMKLKEIDFYSESVSMKELKSITSCLRFFNNKSWNLVQMKAQFPRILACVRSTWPWSMKRDWLVSNINGLGMKTASHFLRNMGCRELAVIDTHIVKFLEVEKPRNKQEYLDIEREFLDVSKKNSLEPAVLDSYIWKVRSNTDYVNYDY